MKDDNLVDAILVDYSSAPIDQADIAMLGYVDKLTRSPGKISKRDVDKLADAGFSISAILDIAQVAAYYAFVNRIADGLGVELESHSSSDKT